jgi:transcriptional regulator with XRE-family HTH domain
MKITGRQLAAARILTGLSQRQLARQAGINVDTLSSAENSGTVNCHEATLEKLLSALGRHGVALAPNSIIFASI